MRTPYRKKQFSPFLGRSNINESQSRIREVPGRGNRARNNVFLQVLTEDCSMIFPLSLFSEVNLLIQCGACPLFSGKRELELYNI